MEEDNFARIRQAQQERFRVLREARGVAMRSLYSVYFIKAKLDSAKTQMACVEARMGKSEGDEARRRLTELGAKYAEQADAYAIELEKAKSLLSSQRDEFKALLSRVYPEPAPEVFARVIFDSAPLEVAAHDEKVPMKQARAWWSDWLFRGEEKREGD